MKRVFAVSTCVCLAVVILAGRSSAQPPAPVVGDVPSLLKLQPAKDAPGDDDLKKLLKARYNEAIAEVRGLMQFLELGRSSLEEVCTRAERLLDAGLELAENSAERVELLTRYLETTRAVEDITRAKVEAGAATTVSLHRARFHRLDAEIRLMRAKRAATGSARTPLEAPKPREVPQLETYTCNAFSILAPDGWLQESGGAQNHEWVQFSFGLSTIRARDDSAGIADIIAGPDRGKKMTDRTKEVIHEIHLAKGDALDAELEDFKEDAPVPFDCKFGMGRWSAFSHTEGTQLKAKFRGIRATIQSETKTMVLRCTCHESDWATFKPIFEKIVTSAAPGNRK